MRGRIYSKVIFTAIYCLALMAFLFSVLKPAITSATAENHLNIPGINLDTPVETVERSGTKLPVPETIAGAYSENDNKTLIFGHATTIFKDLKDLQAGDFFTYNDQTYQITGTETVEKSKISMDKLLEATNTPTIIIMTCAGAPLSNTDTTHRLLITSVAV